MICDPWIDRDWRPVRKPRPDRVFKKSQAERDAMRAQRDLLRSLKQCICGPLVGNVGRGGVVHGPPVDAAGRCQRCVDVKKGLAS